MLLIMIKKLCGIMLLAVFVVGCGKDIDPEPQQPDVENPDDDPGHDDEPDVPDDTTDTVELAYRIGDYYSEGFIKGIVVNVDSTGEHGYVMALDEIVTVWSYKFENVMYGLPSSDGNYNCDMVESMEGWKENYPGFLWAEEKNILGLDSWYIPSSAEMSLMYNAFHGEGSEADKEWFNECLTSNGGSALEDTLYWTSGEMGPQIAYVFDMATNTNSLDQETATKTNEYPFRAICRF